MIKSISIRQLAILLLLIGIACVPTFALAQIPEIVPKNCQGENAAKNCGICELAQVGQNLLNGGIYMAVFLSAILFAYAGWLYLTAGGEEGSVGQAKNIFWNVGIGLVIILVAWLIVDIIIKVLAGGQFQAMPWHKVCMLFIQSLA